MPVMREDGARVRKAATALRHQTEMRGRDDVTHPHLEYRTVLTDDDTVMFLSPERADAFERMNANPAVSNLQIPLVEGIESDAPVHVGDWV